MAKANEEALRIKALELAVASGAGANSIAMADAFLTFLGSTTPNPTSASSAKTTTASQAADTSEQLSNGDTAAPAPSTTLDAGTAAPIADADTAPSGQFDKAHLEKQCMLLNTKGGTKALKEQFTAVGASKFSEIPVDKYPALLAGVEAKIAELEAAEAMS